MPSEDEDVRISLVLPRDLLTAVDQLAAVEQRSRAGEIRRALQRHVDNHSASTRGE